VLRAGVRVEHKVRASLEYTVALECADLSATPPTLHTPILGYTENNEKKKSNATKRTGEHRRTHTPQKSAATRETEKQVHTWSEKPILVEDGERIHTEERGLQEVVQREGHGVAERNARARERISADLRRCRVCTFV
jgi:hypothetical protein